MHGVRIIYSVSLLIFLVSQISMAFGLPPVLHLVPLLAISLFSLLSAYLQWGRWLAVAWGWAYLVAWFMEYLGSNYGVVFGSYKYGDLLTPKIFEVPLLIPHLWFVVVYISYLATGSRLGAVLLAALWDLAYDPLFAHIGLWKWETGFVPFTNFLGWLITAGLVSIAFRHVNTTIYESISYIIFTAAYIPLAVKYGVYWAISIALFAMVIAIVYKIKTHVVRVEERRATYRSF